MYQRFTWVCYNASCLMRVVLHVLNCALGRLVMFYFQGFVLYIGEFLLHECFACVLKCAT